MDINWQYLIDHFIVCLKIDVAGLYDQTIETEVCC